MHISTKKQKKILIILSFITNLMKMQERPQDARWVKRKKSKFALFQNS